MNVVDGNLAVANKFEDHIIRDFGEVPISNTQKYRVLLVDDADLGVRISAQKWWRPSSKDEWKAGKGFKLTGRQAMELGKLLTDLGTQIQHIKPVK